MTDNTAAVIVHEHTRQFHLTNGRISYVFHADGQGKAIGVAFEYSGNFDPHAEVDTFDVARVQVGVNDFGFSWRLAPGETFQSPEALLAFSAEGLTGLSHAFHRTVLEHIVRGPWKRRERPVLINNWEATYFDFDEDRLVDIARTARNAGIELFVLDDGWFGARNDDTAGLGDWRPNPRRLPNGLASLARRVNDLGMRFGLWFEPEAVNADSDLYRAHPDWAIRTPGRKPSHGRNEYLLNFADAAVVDNIFEQMSALLGSANISYIKWDMNRFVSEGYDLSRDALPLPVHIGPCGPALIGERRIVRVLRHLENGTGPRRRPGAARSHHHPSGAVR